MNVYTLRAQRKKLDQLKRKREQKNGKPSDTVIIIDDISEKENGYDNN